MYRPRACPQLSSSGEVDCREEVLGGLVVAGSDGAELLEPAVEVFDEMAGLLESAFLSVPINVPSA